MAEPKIFTDQLGRTIVLKQVPTRIVSLVPSQTELLYALGLDEEVIAQTLFCIHPHSQHLVKTRIGGTKTLNIEKINALKPDLIIGNKEENTRDQIAQLMPHYPVWMSDVQNLPQALEMIIQVGLLVNRALAAEALAALIKNKFHQLQQAAPFNKTCLYLIWRNPYMAAGVNTFINDMLTRCGFINLATGTGGRYPQISTEQLQYLSPQCILLSSEPFPFAQKHADELHAICPDAHIVPVDGELFSWYGNRLIKSVPYFMQLTKQLNRYP